MINVNSEYGHEYFPGLDIAYKVNKNTKIFGSYNISMRTPNYTELYYSSPTDQGNKNLKSEKSNNKEIGLSLERDNYTSTITFYNRDGKNMIDWILTNGDSIWRTQNFNQIITNGYEINSKINVSKVLKTNFPISYLNINYAVNKSNLKSNNFQSRYVIDHLASNLSLSISQLIGQKLKIKWKLSRQDREGGYILNNSDEEVEYLPFWLADIRLSYKVFKINSIFLEINNLLNETYVDYGNVPQPNRWIRIGTKIKL